MDFIQKHELMKEIDELGLELEKIGFSFRVWKVYDNDKPYIIYESLLLSNIEKFLNFYKKLEYLKDCKKCNYFLRTAFKGYELYFFDYETTDSYMIKFDRFEYKMQKNDVKLFKTYYGRTLYDLNDCIMDFVFKHIVEKDLK